LQWLAASSNNAPHCLQIFITGRFALR